MWEEKGRTPFQEDLANVDRLAQQLAIPRSAVIRILIMEALETRKPPKPV